MNDPSRFTFSRRALLALPLAGAVASAVAFHALLRRMQAGHFDPHALAHPLVGHAVPAFDLPALMPHAGHRGFDRADLCAQSTPVLVHFFASWCAPCAQEMPLLMQIQRDVVPVWGVAYKDHPADVAAFAARHGDPFQRLGQDGTGQVGIDWGIGGVPETWLVAAGVVRACWVGAVDPHEVARTVAGLA